MLGLSAFRVLSLRPGAELQVEPVGTAVASCAPHPLFTVFVCGSVWIGQWSATTPPIRAAPANRAVPVPSLLLQIPPPPLASSLFSS